MPLARQETGPANFGGSPGDLIDIYDLEELLDQLSLGSTAGDFDAIGDGSGNPVLDFFRNASGALVVIGGFGAVLLGAFALYFLLGFATTRFQSPKTRIRKSYKRMLRYARWAGYNPTEARTPMEFGLALSADLYSRGRPRRQRRTARLERDFAGVRPGDSPPGGNRDPLRESGLQRSRCRPHRQTLRRSCMEEASA